MCLEILFKIQLYPLSRLKHDFLSYPYWKLVIPSTDTRTVSRCLVKLTLLSMTTIAISGGFDPIHIGHIEMMQEAKKLGDKLVVIVNNDNWLNKKKGFAFMPEKERAAIIQAVRYVDEVIITEHQPDTTDMSVCVELKTLKPDIFANGGDRKPDGDPVPEVELCNSLGIKLIYNVGKSGKIQSSSELVKRVKEKTS